MPQPPQPLRTGPDRPLLIRALRDVLTQAQDSLEGIEPGAFVALPTGHGGQGLTTSGPGAHLRHIMDFVRRFLEGIEGGTIDYDRRARDPMEESDPVYAGLALKGLIARMDALEEFDAARAVQVRHDLPGELLRAAGSRDGGGEAAEWTASSLGRELLFVLSHTIHHYAIMAMCLRAQGVQPAAGFGVAPSTLRYWQELGDAPSMASPAGHA